MKPHKKIKEKTYDLFTKNEKWTRRGTPEDALRLGLWRKMVHIFIFNNKGELLVCKRPPYAERYPSQITSSAGGHVEHGETYREAAARELKEELGIRPKLTDAGRFDVRETHGNIIHRLFTGHAKKVALNTREIASCMFLKLRKVKEDLKAHPRRYAKPFHAALSYHLSKNDKETT